MSETSAAGWPNADLSQLPAIDRFSYLLQCGHADGTFVKPESRRTFLYELGPEGFEAWTGALNQVLREPSATQVTGFEQGDHALDGDTPGTSDYIPPPANDRKTLLYEAYEAARYLPDLDRAGTLLGAVIAICRPFGRCNNATAIAVQQLLSHGHSGSTEDADRYNALFHAPSMHDQRLKYLVVGGGLGYGFARNLGVTFARELTNWWRKDAGMPYQAMVPRQVVFNRDWADPKLSPEAVTALRRIIEDDVFTQPLFVEFILKDRPQWDLADYYDPTHVQGSAYDTESLQVENIVWMLGEEEVATLSKRYAALKQAFVRQVTINLEGVNAGGYDFWQGQDLGRSFLDYSGIEAIVEPPRWRLR